MATNKNILTMKISQFTVVALFTPRCRFLNFVQVWPNKVAWWFWNQPQTNSNVNEIYQECMKGRSVKLSISTMKYLTHEVILIYKEAQFTLLHPCCLLECFYTVHSLCLPVNRLTNMYNGAIIE